MPFMHDYMDVGGRVTHGAVTEDARAEEQLMTLPQKRYILAERSHLYTDWYKADMIKVPINITLNGSLPYTEKLI